MNNRRKLVIALGASPFTAPLCSFAQQQGKVWRIGVLGLAGNQAYARQIDALRAGLRDLGYMEGKNIVIEYRWAEGNNALLPGLAAELVKMNVDVIVTHGAAGTRAAKQATTTIPIVFASTCDVVTLGFVTNLARPSGNMTGGIFFDQELVVKRIQLLKDVLPRLTQVAMLVNPDNPSNPLNLQVLEATVRSLKVTLHKFPVRGLQEFAGAFAAMDTQRVGAIVFDNNAMIIANPAVLAEFAAKRRMPTIGPSEIAMAGGLMSYGVDFAGMWHRAAYFVDKILKGTKPGDIPVEQATRFEMFVNLKTAKALGIKIPNLILVQATKVIE